MVCSDAPAKQLIMHLNETRQFVIKDLDETHVLIDPVYLDFVTNTVEETLEKNIWVGGAS